MAPAQPGEGCEPCLLAGDPASALVPGPSTSASVGEAQESLRGPEQSAKAPLPLPPRRKFQKKGASQSFSKAARLKWQSLERRIIDIVMQRMTIVNLEADMERLIKVGPPHLSHPTFLLFWLFTLSPVSNCAPHACSDLRVIPGRWVAWCRGRACLGVRHAFSITVLPQIPPPQKREELFLLQEALRRKRERLQAESPEEEKGLQELAEEIEVLAANIDYINDSITDCQATIVQLEETKVPTGPSWVGRSP